MPYPTVVMSRDTVLRVKTWPPHNVDTWNNLVPSREVYESTSGTRRPKPKGWLAPTSYLMVYDNIVWPRGYVESFDPETDLRNRYDGVIMSSSNMSPIQSANMFVDDLYSEADFADDDGHSGVALNKALSKLKSKSVDLGVAYGERKQTARLFEDSAAQLAKAYSSLKRGNFRKAMDALGISRSKPTPSRALSRKSKRDGRSLVETKGGLIPQAWLQLQYGWKPVLSDIYGAAEALEKRPSGDWRVTAKASSSDQWTGSWDAPDTLYLRWCHATVSKSVYCRIDAIPGNGLLRTLSSVGALNPLSVAWERVPFSFLVDWAIPIGQFIDNLDATLGYSSGCVSSSSWKTIRLDVVGRSGLAPAGETVTSSYAGYQERRVLVRTVNQSLPLPALPSFKDPVSSGHVANGLALLTQVFKPGYKSYLK